MYHAALMVLLMNITRSCGWITACWLKHTALLRLDPASTSELSYVLHTMIVSCCADGTVDEHYCGGCGWITARWLEHTALLASTWELSQQTPTQQARWHCCMLLRASCTGSFVPGVAEETFVCI
jgi:hypothetical protein